ncbi:MAG: tetratricopeptide repeat protein, partial [Terriglobia bacterium]
MLYRFHLATLAIVLTFFSVRSDAAAQTQDVSRIFEAGNEYYAQSNYKAAIAQYQKVLESGVVSETVLYNLANAYFKNNQLGESILYYEKAQRISPLDREISENLNFARARIADKVERPQEEFFVSQLRRITNWLPLDTETALAVVFFIAANAAFALFWLDAISGLSRLALYASIAFLGLFMILGSSNLLRIYWQ